MTIAETDLRYPVRNFLDEAGRLRTWPARRKLQLPALDWLAAQFEPTCDYTERQVNELLDRLHTFGDAAMLRRDLVDGGWLARERDGSKYWRREPEGG